MIAKIALSGKIVNPEFDDIELAHAGWATRVETTLFRSEIGHVRQLTFVGRNETA